MGSTTTNSASLAIFHHLVKICCGTPHSANHSFYNLKVLSCEWMKFWRQLSTLMSDKKSNHSDDEFSVLFLLPVSALCFLKFEYLYNWKSLFTFWWYFSHSLIKIGLPKGDLMQTVLNEDDNQNLLFWSFWRRLTISKWSEKCGQKITYTFTTLCQIWEKRFKEKAWQGKFRTFI